MEENPLIPPEVAAVLIKLHKTTKDLKANESNSIERGIAASTAGTKSLDLGTPETPFWDSLRLWRFRGLAQLCAARAGEGWRSLAEAEEEESEYGFAFLAREIQL